MRKNSFDITSIKNKIAFEKVFYQFKYNGVLVSKLSVDKEYSEGFALTKIGDELKTMTIHYKGDLKVAEGGKIKEGDEIALSGRLKKTLLVSPVSGKVIKIDEDKKVVDIEYSVLSKEKVDEFKPTIMPFNAKVVKKLPKSLLLEFSAFTINLFALKGSDAIGELIYIERKDFFGEDSDPVDVKGAIVLTETVDTEFAAKLSALGVNGILVNEIGYQDFNNIMTLSMPIGVIAGFGNIGFDKELKAYLKTLEKSKVVIDDTYNKAHILTDIKPDIES